MVEVSHCAIIVMVGLIALVSPLLIFIMLPWAVEKFNNLGKWLSVNRQLPNPTPVVMRYTSIVAILAIIIFGGYQLSGHITLTQCGEQVNAAEIPLK